MSGWIGRIAFVDLTAKTVRYEPTSSYRDFIGGRGMGGILASDIIPAGSESLSPLNAIIIMSGPLAGTLAPSSSRLAVVFKNALTGGFGSSNVGGDFAGELKYSGMDGIVILGKADAPTYISVFDNQVEFHSAEHLWGKTTGQTTELIKNELGNDRVTVASIGPAGENLCRVACTMVDGSKAAAYGGVGAVWGSKNLKAIAVGGNNPVEIADPDAFELTVKHCINKVLSGRSISALRRYGAVITGNGGIDGSLPQPVRNLQDGYWSPEKTLKLSALVFKEVYEGHRVASLGCPIGCGRVYNFASGGENVQFQGLQANAVSNYGPFLDCDDPIKILEATFSANELGLDWDGSSAAIAWAFEAFERGILTLEDTDGLELRWGNGSATVELLHKMALRQGIGALLADGPLFATKRINCGLEFAMHVKGAPLRETWLQIDPMWSLGIAVATRGSGHLNGAIKLRVLQSAPDTVKDEMRRFGLNVTFPNPSPEEIASAVAWFENYKSVVDSLGLCYFTSWWADPLALGPDDYADLMSAATGISSTGSSILEQGNRIHNVEKAFNTLHAGLDRQNDYLPDRLYSNEISAGPDKGAKLDRKQFEDLLDHYYAHREYDIRNGWQTPDSLKKLGLSQIAERLCDAGRLGHMN